MNGKIWAYVRAFGIFASVILMAGSAVRAQAVKPVLVALNKADATLAIFDPVSMKQTGKVATGFSPHEVVLSADGKTAYVSNYGDGPNPGNSISVIDVAAAKELRRFDTSPLIRPHGLLMLGGKLYFTSETNRIIARYDPAANKIDWMMGTGQNGSHMIVGTADQKNFYTTNIGSDSVTAFHFQNPPPANSQIIHIPLSPQPEAIDLSPDGKEVWAGLNVDGGIDIVDTATNKQKEKVDTKGRPYRVKFTPDGRRVLCSIPAAKDLVLIDAVTRKEIKRLKLDTTPIGVAISADGKWAFVTANEPDTVLKIDLEKMEIAGRAEPGKGPDGVAVAGI